MQMMIYTAPTCGMMVSFERRFCRPICEMVFPSITMEPAADSMIRNRASVIDDFPAPVRPTMPTFKSRRGKFRVSYEEQARQIFAAILGALLEWWRHGLSWTQVKALVFRTQFVDETTKVWLAKADQ